MVYKGRRLEATPHRRPDENGWSTEVTITEDVGGRFNITPQTAVEIWPTKDEAIAHSFNYGKQIVDGAIRPTPPPSKSEDK